MRRTATARSRKPPRDPKATRSSPRPRARKISITVDDGVLRAIEKEAKRSGRTLSAEVTDALARELRRRRLRDLISEYEADHGEIATSELASIQEQWRD